MLLLQPTITAISYRGSGTNLPHAARLWPLRRLSDVCHLPPSVDLTLIIGTLRLGVVKPSGRLTDTASAVRPILWAGNLAASAPSGSATDQSFGPAFLRVDLGRVAGEPPEAKPANPLADNYSVARHERQPAAGAIFFSILAPFSWVVRLH